MSTTVTLPDDLHAQVLELAADTGRTVEEVFVEAVAQALAYDRWFRAEVEKGIRSTDAGRFASPEDVEAMWDRLTTPKAMAEAEAELGDLGLSIRQPGTAVPWQERTADLLSSPA